MRQRGRAPGGLGRDESGAALVELALILPVLLTLVLAAVDFGRLIVTGLALSAAVRAGAQWGAQSTAESRNNARIQAVTVADFGTRYGTMATSDVTVSQFCRCPGNANNVNCATPSVCGSSYLESQAFVSVSASRTVNFFMWAPRLGRSYTTTRTAVLRVQ